MGESIRRRAAGLALAAVITGAASLAGCAPDPPSWRPVADAGPGSIVTLTPTSSGVLVGRYHPDRAEASSIQARGPDGTVTDVPLSSQPGGYGPEATLVSLAARDGELVALGGRAGGAHGNVRWTVWRGAGSGLQEQPQPFETFGGWEAGPLTGVADGADGPVIVGGRVSRSGGMDVTLWRPEATRWVQPRPAVIAAASASELPSAGAVIATRDAYLVAGWVTRLGERVTDDPVVWSATDPAGVWTRTALPVPDGRATLHPSAMACAESHCAVVARTDDSVIYWRLTLRPGQPPTPCEPITITARHTADAGNGPAGVAVAALAATDVIAYSSPDGTATVTVQDEQASPADTVRGTLVALAASTDDEALLAVTAEDGATRLFATAP